MKKTLLTLSLALTAAFASAQADSVEVYRFTYEFCDSNVIAKRNYPDRMHLDIQKNGTSEFYSHYGQQRANVMQIEGSGHSPAEIQAQIARMRATKAGVGYRILKNFPDRGRLTFADQVALSPLFYTDEIVQPDWTLADDEKEICGYRCRKAETDFLGRHWTAWYTAEIPMSNGPWKLGGLPGLILEASDSNNFFRFSCVGMETVKTLPTTKLDKKYVKCSHKEFERMEREYYADEMAFLLNQVQGEGKTIRIEDERGNEIKSTPKRDHIFIEKSGSDEK